MAFVKKEIILHSKNIPKHIAIIMDGNGRWAKKRGLPRTLGHKAGTERISEIIKECIQLNINVVTVYAFSMENWKRNIEEIEYIFNLLLETLNKKEKDLIKNNIRLNIIGDLYNLNNKYDVLIKKIESIKEKTKDNTGLIFNIAFNYSSHNEIINAVKNICKDYKNKLFDINTIDEHLFENYLMTKDLPSIDLLIRTSGEKRLSNFLLWQLSYTELIFTDIYWPDFDGYELRKCIYEYQKRDRRFGSVK